ncbi:MAG: prepilin-type N-terminal cleavage/methylation domain-containing protein [Candidatus Omnitrophota bacterium]
MISRTGKRSGRIKASGGFTLIELALVIVIVLIVIGLASPILKHSTSDLALKDTAFNVSKLSQYGQEKAILERKNFKMVFDFKDMKYQLMEFDTAADPPGYRKMDGKFGRAYRVPPGFSIEGGNGEVVFYPDGRCDEAEIRIKDARGNGYSIKVRGFGPGPEIKAIGDER